MDDISLEELISKDSDDLLPFTGFGPETVIPGKLEIVEDGEDIYVVRKKRKGRPRGLPYIAQGSVSPLAIIDTPRRDSVLSVPPLKASHPSPSLVTPSPRPFTSGTSRKPNIYLLDEPPMLSLGMRKLPKNGAVMRVFFNFLLDDDDRKKHSNSSTVATKASITSAAKATLNDIKQVWLHHFCSKVINGQDYEGSEVKPENIMIIRDVAITDKICKIFHKWKCVEQLSRR